MAEAKRDIRGLRPGTPAAEAIAKFHGMKCRLIMAPYNLNTRCFHSGTRDERGQKVDQTEELSLSIAGHLPNQPVWAVELSFDSHLTPSEISQAVSQQFAVNVPLQQIRRPQDLDLGVDLGGGLKLRLALEVGNVINGYRLTLWSPALKAAELKAADESRRLQSPAPKF